MPKFKSQRRAEKAPNYKHGEYVEDTRKELTDEEFKKLFKQWVARFKKVLEIDIKY